MRTDKQGINEGLADDISKSLRYSFFVDMYAIINKRGGLLTIMFPNVGQKKLNRWLKGAGDSDLYTQHAEKMEEIYNKISAISSLKTLYRAVNVLKTKETPQAENETRLSDLTLLMSKIGRVIKGHLSQDERELFDSMSPILTPAATDAAKSIEGSVGASTAAPEKQQGEPTQEPTQEPSETPDAEPKASPEQEPAEEPAEEPSEEPAEEPAEEPVEEPEAPKAEPAAKKPAPVQTAPPKQEPAKTAPTAKQPTPAPEKPAPAKQAPAPQKPSPAPQKPSPAPQKAEKPTEPSDEEENEKNEAVIMRYYLKALIREIVERKLGLR